MPEVIALTLRKARKYGLVARTSLQNSLAYRANFIFDSFFYAFIVFIFMQLWRSIFHRGGSIAGYSYSQILWYLIITEMLTFSQSNVFEDLNQDIKSGNIAYLLNKPFHYLLYQCANGTGPILVKWLINGLTGLALGSLWIGPLAGFSPIRLPLLLLAMANGLLLNFLAMACLGLSAFWLEENTAFYWIYQKLTFILGLFLPLEFLPAWAQRIALWLPFSYVNYGPAKLVVAFSGPAFIRIVTVQFLYILGLAALAGWIFRRGVKRINVNGG
jgi:ABC-2 type transport system permease protein